MCTWLRTTTRRATVKTTGKVRVKLGLGSISCGLILIGTQQQVQAWTTVILHWLPTACGLLYKVSGDAALKRGEETNQLTKYLPCWRSNPMTP